MKIMSWNCQGLGSSLTTQALRALVAQEKPTVLFLMETKNKEEKVSRWGKKLKYDQSFVVNPIGTRGGLALLWNSSAAISINYASAELIDIECEEDSYRTKMHVTFVYAPTNLQDRLKVWEDIKQLGRGGNLPWLCIGDFNEIMYHWEKVGKRMAIHCRLHAFREFLDSCEFMDLESKGCSYTWSNNRDGVELVKERLDRAVCTLEWRLKFPEAEVFALPAIGSDHSPLLVTLFPSQRKKRRFIFESYWMEDAECRDVVKEAWKPETTGQHNLITCMVRVTTALQKWSKHKFSHGQDKIKLLMEEVRVLTNSRNTRGEKEKIQELKRDIEKLWNQEEQYWGMRSRITWLKWGDKNSKFFHATTIQRRQRNRITMLQNSEGQWIRDHNQLKQIIQHYYRNLYSTAGARDFSPILQFCPSIVKEETNRLLLAEITLEEVQTAAFQLGSTKAPGPDGLNGQFYQRYWEDIKEEVMFEIQQFFQTGILNPKLNRTLVTLVPKVQHPERVEQFRPISVCNFVYKIISKLLVNRLKQWLPELIEPEQSAFIGGRQIQDNILVVQEVLHQLRVRKRKKKFQAVLKVDMQKAYDRIEWDFLKACMLKMGFEERWVQLIMQCVMTSSLSIKLNGDVLPFFTPSRGLRQGDPLSPYLFILVSNVLSNMIKTAVMDGTLKGIKLNRHCPTLSHLLFADDSIFFLDGTIQECQNLTAIMNQYCFASGQAINLNKSGVYFSKNCPCSLKTNMASTLRVPVIDKTGKYLGIPSDWGESKKQMFAWILARVNMKLEGWKEKLLSKAGKEVLLKAVVQALPQYAMSIFKIPVSICKAIEKRVAAFWWKNQSTKTGIHLKKWEVLKQRKDKGGLGFRDLTSFNKAMLGKQAWRLSQASTTLCGKVLKGLYFPTKSFWRAEKGSRPSWGWLSMLLGRDSIEDSVLWSVGDGKMINIREDKWLRRGKLGGPANISEPTKVSELINPDNNSWNEGVLNRMYEEQIVKEILATPIRSQTTSDKLIWTATKGGDYTVKSSYNLIYNRVQQPNLNQASSSYQTSSSLWNRIWSINTPHKIRIFLWSLCQNSLPTKENLFRRKISPDPGCPICKNSRETDEHLLFHCKWTKRIWEHPVVNLQISPAQISRTDQWLDNLNSSEGNSPDFELVAVILWQIWKMRNNLVFRNRPPDPDEVVEESQFLLMNHRKWNPQATQKKKMSTCQSESWEAPMKGELKINLDASHVPGSAEGFIACVCRDSSGRLIDGFAQQVRATTAEQAETHAMVEALKFLSPRADAKLVLESDCLSLVLVLKSTHGRTMQATWDTHDLIQEAHGLMVMFSDLRIEFCNRSANYVADWVAKAHRKRVLPLNWLAHPPPGLCDLLCLEAPLVDSGFFK